MGRPRTFDEGQVVQRARETFHDLGYAATSVDQLTRATGLRRSSLYGAFGDKHGLFLAAFDAYCEEVITGVERELAGDDDGALARLTRHMCGQTPDPAASIRGCLLAKATAERAGADPDVAQRAAAAFTRYEAALTNCLHQAQAAGDVRDDVTPPAAAALLLAVLRGIEALGRAQRTPEALRLIADTALMTLAPAVTS